MLFRSPRQRLLICAPSNTAVDELAQRLLQGIPVYLGEPGEIKTPSIVRIGDPTLVHPAVQCVHLEQLVQAKVGIGATKKEIARARRDIIKKAEIVCATLSGAGAEVLTGQVFETVIIDEAAQANEPSVLIPLKYSCDHCILVGGMYTHYMTGRSA